MTQHPPRAWPILTEEELTTITHAHDYDEPLVFASSGTKPKRIPYTDNDQERLADDMAAALTSCGLTEDDAVLNLGASMDRNHQSGWLVKHGTEELGAEALNDSIKDYREVIERSEDVTAISSLPRLIQAEGEKLEEEYGDLEELFPNMRIAITAGDTLTENLRDTLKEQWGLETVQTFYASTEGGAPAAEDGNGDMVPVSDSIYMEILEEDVEPDPETGAVPEDAVHPVDQIEEPVTGSMLITARDRERLPLVRYRIGDVFTAYPDDDGPRLRFEGREGDVISLSGALLYPSEIENAVQEQYGGVEWRAVASHEEDYPALDIYVIDAGHEAGDIRDSLFNQNYAIQTLYDAGTIHHIEEHTVESLNALQEELEQYDLENELVTPGPKTQRVGCTTNYAD